MIYTKNNQYESETPTLVKITQVVHIIEIIIKIIIITTTITIGETLVQKLLYIMKKDN
jgi:hypothetical protein